MERTSWVKVQTSWAEPALTGSGTPGPLSTGRHTPEAGRCWGKVGGGQGSRAINTGWGEAAVTVNKPQAPLWQNLQNAGEGQPA